MRVVERLCFRCLSRPVVTHHAVLRGRRQPPGQFAFERDRQSAVLLVERENQQSVLQLVAVDEGVGDPFAEDAFPDVVAPGEIVEEILPENYVLAGAFPNPFNPVTTIQYALPEAGKVTLTVFDITGREVARIVDGYRDAGWHSVTFEAEHLASGLYVYRLEAGDFIGHEKMVLVK